MNYANLLDQESFNTLRNFFCTPTWPLFHWFVHQYGRHVKTVYKNQFMASKHVPEKPSMLVKLTATSVNEPYLRWCLSISRSLYSLPWNNLTRNQVTVQLYSTAESMNVYLARRRGDNERDDLRGRPLCKTQRKIKKLGCADVLFILKTKHTQTETRKGDKRKPKKILLNI